MKLVGVMVLALASTASANSYKDNGKTVAHDCAKDPEVIIMGNDNTVTVIGPCTKLNIAGNKNVITAASSKVTSLSGSENTVTIEAIDDVVATGSKNTLTYKKTVSKTKPSIAHPGKDNKITQGK